MPEYYKIPDELKPPLIVHYLYKKTKIILAIILGLAALIVSYMLIKNKDFPYAYLIAFPVIAQVVSFLGWAVREDLL